ncbi:MAG TPA: sporulation protein [Bacillus bacterium]|uniref:Sporulation membrane protein YtrI n=1 Tax=Siminovitchia fordii TaxID=254759 RepID=A0ABQ4K8M4_9BACI|nr:sporulation membrane protein YtrI [Siminovitchia fordii]GIN22079.1 sporulation membrane protein YtrI [Siminovitchia fordii]HBZ11361.1 sporulation protein [Bacillus sp. (in: firmicutes)]
MRIPPLYRHPVWQRFFAGAAVGGCISWLVFLFMFGTIQQKNSTIIERQAIRIKELNGYIQILEEDYQKLNQKNEDMLTIQEIEVKIQNFERYGIKDRLGIYKAEESVKEDLRSLIAKDLTTVYKNKEVIKKTVENKTLNINGKQYRLIVKELYFYTTISLVLEMKLAD